MERIDIIQTTWNRLELLKKSIEGFIARTKTPYRLIIVDNGSNDGTQEYLLELSNKGLDILIINNNEDKVSIAHAFTQGFMYVESEYFITTNDDIIPPDLEPDWIQQLISLMKKYPEHGGIDCRIQEIPNMNWNNDHPDLAYPRKSLGGYLRIQRKSDVQEMGGFGDRTWDDLEFFKRMTVIGKKCAYAKNIWANHMGYNVENKGYGKFIDYPLYHEYYSNRFKKKPYPEINPKTNEPI